MYVNWTGVTPILLFKRITRGMRSIDFFLFWVIFSYLENAVVHIFVRTINYYFILLFYRNVACDLLCLLYNFS